MNFKRTAAIVAVSSLLLGLAGCGRVPGTTPGMNKGGFAYDALAKRKRERGGKWAILVHLAGENNLYRFALEDLNEMEAGLPTDGSIEVYVLFDGIKNGDSCIYKIKRDTGMNGNIISEKLNAPEVIPANGEVDSGDVNVVKAFVEWAGKNVKADHYFIDFWDHGSGLFHGSPNPLTKGFGWDDNGSNLETHDLTTLGAAFKNAAGRPFTAVGFDACLMAHGEIAYQLKGAADYLVASEELEPGKGWDYRGWLEAAGKSDLTPVGVTSALVDSFAASYAPGGSQSSGRDDITLSSLDVNAFNSNVVPALNEWVAAANATMSENKAMFQAARSKTQTFYNRDCADLGHFLANVKSSVQNKNVAAATAKVQAAYSASIVREVHSKKYTGATGVVLYFPTPSQNINSGYGDPAKILFAETGWKTFLKNYR